MSFPLGLATIVAIVKQQGHEVQVIDFDVNRTCNKKAFLEKITPIPDVVMLTGMITNYVRVRELAEIVKLIWPNTILILGGSLSTTAPVSILNRLDVDIFVIGEGDETIKWCMEAISSGESLERVSGIKIKKGNKIISTEGKTVPPDITKTPRPCYEAFPMQSYLNFLNESGRCFEIYTSKGCPFSCTYCYRISGNRVRHRMIDDIILEIKFIMDTYSINRFSFEDDSFALNKAWVREFCAKVKRLDIKFRFQASAKALNEEMLELLLDAGLSGVSLGIESGSPLILNEVQKKIDVVRTEKLIKWFRSHNIKYNASFIIGSFSETGESIEMTKDFLIRNGFTDNFQLFFLTPYPGTQLYRNLLDQGSITDEVEYVEKLTYQDTLNINLTEYPSEKLLDWRDYIIQEVLASHQNQPSIYAGCTWKKEAIQLTG